MLKNAKTFKAWVKWLSNISKKGIGFTVFFVMKLSYGKLTYQERHSG